jgi:hypothetical protein
MRRSSSSASRANSIDVNQIRHGRGGLRKGDIGKRLVRPRNNAVIGRAECEMTRVSHAWAYDSQCSCPPAWSLARVYLRSLAAHRSVAAHAFAVVEGRSLSRRRLDMRIVAADAAHLLCRVGWAALTRKHLLRLIA